MPDIKFYPLNLDQPAAAPAAPPPPPVPSWQQVTADPRWNEAKADKRLEVLDKWVMQVNQNRAAVTGFDPARVYDFAQAKREEIQKAESTATQALDVAKQIPGMVRDAAAGAGVVVWEQLPKLTGNQNIPTPTTDRMATKAGKFIEGAVMNNYIETATLKEMQKEFTDALGREQVPQDPGEMRDWMAGWNNKLLAQARKAYPNSTILSGDAATLGSRSLTDNEDNLADMSGFLQTKNPQYMERVFNRVTSPDSTTYYDKEWEKTLKPLPEWRKRAMEAGSDPVNVLAMAASAGVGSMAAAPLRAGASKVAQVAIRGSALVADAELNAQAAKVSAWVQNQNASDAELDSAGRMGRFASYMFAGLGFGGRKLLDASKAIKAKPEAAHPASDAVAPETPPPVEPPSEPVMMAEEMPPPMDAPPESIPLVKSDNAADLASPLETIAPETVPQDIAPQGRASGKMPRTLDPEPESPATVAVQAERLAAGSRPAMLVTKGEAMPTVPEGFQTVDVPEGTVIFDPQTFDSAGIHEAAAANQLGDVLAYGVPAKSAAADRAVVLRDEAGTEVAAVAATAAEVPQVTTALEQQAKPTDAITVESPADVVAARVENAPTVNRKPIPPPGIPKLPGNAMDIWNFLEDNPINIPRRRKGVKRGGELDANLPEGVPPRYMKVFSQTGKEASTVAQAAYDNMVDGVHTPLIDAPTTEALKARMNADMDYRRTVKDQISREDRIARELDVFRAHTAPRKSSLMLDPSTMQAGDSFKVRGNVYEVNAVRPDIVSITKAGSRGEMLIKPGEVLHVDTITRQTKAPGINKDRSPAGKTARFEEAIQIDAGGKLPVPAAALQIGDTIQVDGTTLKVVNLIDNLDEAGTVDVQVDDGRRFGRQTLADGAVIYAEKVTRAKDKPPVSGTRAESAAAALENEVARTGRPVPPAVTQLVQQDAAPVEAAAPVSSERQPNVGLTDAEMDAQRAMNRAKLEEMKRAYYEQKARDAKAAKEAAPLALESVDDATLKNERDAAATKEKLADGKARRLTAKELDTTGDLLDPLAGENALFTQPYHLRADILPEGVKEVAKAALEHAGASLGPGASAAAEWRPHKATARMANDLRLSGRTRELFTEGQDYRVISHMENLDEVRAIIEKEGGLRQAIEAIDSPELEGRHKVALADLAIRKLDTERAMASTADEVNALDDAIDEVARKLNRINLDAGRAIEANKHISLLTPESVLSELAERVKERVEQKRNSPLGKKLEEQKAEIGPKLEGTEREIVKSTNEAAAATAAEVESLRQQLEEARRQLHALEVEAARDVPDDVAAGPNDAVLLDELTNAEVKVTDLEATAAKTEAGSPELISLQEQIQMAKVSLGKVQREVLSWERARGKQYDATLPRDSQLTLGIKDYPIRSKESVIQAQLARLDLQFDKMKEMLGWTPEELARNEVARKIEASRANAEKMSNMDERVAYMRQTVNSMRQEMDKRRRAILPKADAELARLRRIEREITELNNMASLTDEQLVAEQARRSIERKAQQAANEGRMSDTMKGLRELRQNLRDQIDDRTTMQARRERLAREEAELSRLLADGTPEEIDAFLNPSRRPRVVEPEDLVTARQRIKELRKAADDLQRRMLGMPPELQSKVRELTAKIRQAPPGVYHADLSRQLMAEVARWEGVDLLALGEEYWMANLLSGVNTQGVNVWSNGVNLFLRTMIASAREGNLKVTADMLAGMGRGAREGGRDFVRSWQGKDVVKWQEKYGLRESSLDKVADMFRGKSGPLARTAQAVALGRYVFRALQGMDAFFWRTAYEGRAAMSVSRWGKSEAARRGVTHAQFMADELHNSTAETTAAMEQATKEAKDLGIQATARDMEARAWEILDSKREVSIRSDAKRYADLNTYTNTPEGSMGIVAWLMNQAVSKLVIPTRFGELRPVKPIMPFVNTLANVTSSAMDFTPIGIARGLHGKHIMGAAKDKLEFSAVESRERIIAGVLGTAGGGLLYGLAGSGGTKEDPYFDVFASGPPDPEKRKQWRNSGAMPFSIKVGKTYYSTKETPLALVLATIGGMRDMERYSKQYSEQDAMARAWYVLGIAPQAVSQQGMMQGIESLSSVMGGNAADLKRLATGVAKGFIPADGLLRDVGRVFDPTVVDSKTLAGAILKDVPVIRRELNKPALNIMGEPVRTEGLARIPVVSRVMSSEKTSDKEIAFIADNGLWVPGFGKTINVGQGLRTKGEEAFADKVVESRVSKLGRVHAGILTDDETRLFIQTQGKIFRHGVKLMAARHANGQGPKDKDGMQRELDKIAEIARQAAMRDMLGLPQRVPNQRRGN
jgi:hypothetical protein